MQTDGALSINEFRDQYRVGHTTIYEEIRAGRLSAVKVGRRTLIPRQAAREWLQSLPTALEAKPAA
jgi:excisionase family DNA binding protein